MKLNSLRLKLLINAVRILMCLCPVSVFPVCLCVSCLFPVCVFPICVFLVCVFPVSCLYVSCLFPICFLFVCFPSVCFPSVGFPFVCFPFVCFLFLSLSLYVVFQDINKRLSLPADIRLPDGYLEKFNVIGPALFEQPISRRLRRVSLVLLPPSTLPVSIM